MHGHATVTTVHPLFIQKNQHQRENTPSIDQTIERVREHSRKLWLKFDFRLIKQPQRIPLPIDSD